MDLVWVIVAVVAFGALLWLTARLASRRADAGDGGPVLGARHVGSHPFIVGSEHTEDDEPGFDGP